MALIAMCVYDTIENKRSRFTAPTLKSLYATVDLENDRIFVVDNGSDDPATAEALAEAEGWEWNFQVITLPENEGTAKGINHAWKLRREGEYLVKMDNDVVIHSRGWTTEMEFILSREPKMGILGLKRKDLLESPYNENRFFKSSLHQVPHIPGEPWRYYERVNHVMGTCQMYTPALIDKIGGLYQMEGLYGFDDSLAAVRAEVAGYFSAFLPYIEIDHIDPGDTPYQKWKEGYAGSLMSKYNETVLQYRSGKKSIYTQL